MLLKSFSGYLQANCSSEFPWERIMIQSTAPGEFLFHQLAVSKNVLHSGDYCHLKDKTNDDPACYITQMDSPEEADSCIQFTMRLLKYSATDAWKKQS